MQNPSDAGNSSLITSSPLFPFVKSTDLFQCTGNLNMMRGFSMNNHMGNSDMNDGSRWFVRQALITKPSNFFVLMDEDSAVINGPAFRVDVGRNLSASGSTLSIADWPATCHGGSSCISFADGHAETHRWKFLGQPPVGYSASGGTSVGDPQSRDVSYLIQISSEASH